MVNGDKISGIYLVTDRELCTKNSLSEVVLAAIKGGVSLVQLREKNISTRLFLKEAMGLKELLKPFNIPLIINDRIDIALAVKAEGVHIGQSDMPYHKARELMGSEAIIGLSVENMDQVKQAQDLDVDYLGVSPVFETSTKLDTKGEWGLKGLSEIRKYSRHKLVAIGGINSTNIKNVVDAGADCVAVVSAICAADDPLNASKNLIGKMK